MKTRRFLKKALSVALCAVLLGGTAVMLPAVSSEVSVIADAAETYGDFQYEISDNEVTITKYTGNGGNVTIPDKIEGKPVTSIGYEAFRGCTGLTSITIPDSVTSIGYEAFIECTGLTSITIPDSVTSIEECAFYDCTGLTRITIPDSVTSISESTFSHCTGLTSIIIPDSVTSIGFYAFSGCTGLTSIIIPDSVTSIGDDAFYDTAWYDNKPDGLVYAGKVAYKFKGEMEDNTKIVLKSGTKGITGYAFYGCTGLTSIRIPDSVTSIGWSAFEDCTGLTSITIPDSVTSIGDSAFRGCTGLTSIDVSENNSEYSSIDGVLLSKNKTELRVYPQGKKGSYSIPDSVTSIGYEAFSGCTGLTSITIPDSVTSIGGDAFCGCTGLTSITIPDSVTSIDEYAFDGCEGLTSITIPDSVISIGWGAFRGCTGLTSIDVSEINSKYSSIDGVLFSKNKTELLVYPQGKKGSYSIPDSVTKIGIGAFSNRTGLTSVTIGNGVTEIGEDAFYGCTGLTSITIPDSVTSIGYEAFRGCTGLTSITIPDSVTSIGYEAFIECTGLTSITIPDSVTSIGYKAFIECTGLTSITIPDSVTSIGDFALGYYINYDYYDMIKDDGFTIYGKKDSAAEKYAADNGFKFVETDFPLKNASSISSDSIKLNETITLIAKASGGTSPYTYAFMYKAPGATSWKVIGTKFGKSDKETFKPTKAGTYEILISVKDSDGKTEAKKFSLTVKDNKLANRSSVSGTDVPCGTKITITGAAEGGEGAYLYTYQIKKPGKTSWTTLGEKYVAETSKVFTTKLSGAYEVRVLVKDGAGTVKSFVATVNSTGTLLTNNSTISATTATVGDKVTIAAVPEGGTAPYRFTYEYKKPGSTSWKTKGKRGATYKSVTLDMETAGTYEARVYIQDASDYVTVKTFKVTVS